jgi:hypothetical protein
MTSAGRSPSVGALKSAADTAGADLLLVLPTPEGRISAVLRFKEDEGESFLQVATTDSGFEVREETDMNEPLLGLARASADVLERMSRDRAIREPLAAAG